MMTKTALSEPTSPSGAVIDADFLVYRLGFAVDGWLVDSVGELVTPGRGERDTLLETGGYFEVPPGMVRHFLNASLEKIYKVLGGVGVEYQSVRGFLTTGNNFRHSLIKLQSKGYKEGRGPRPKHYDLLRGLLFELGCENCEGYEADDAVATELEYDSNLVLVGVDKDLLQIPGWHYNPVKEVWTHVTPRAAMNQFVTQMITGDTTDTIVGLPRQGDKAAEKFLLESDGESPESLFDRLMCLYHDKAPVEDFIGYFNEQATLLWLQRDVYNTTQHVTIDVLVDYFTRLLSKEES